MAELARPSPPRKPLASAKATAYARRGSAQSILQLRLGQWVRMEQSLTHNGAVDPPQCSRCRFPFKVTPCVMEFLGQQIFLRKGPPPTLVEQNSWFCPVCGLVEAERGKNVPITSTTVLLYDPPRCSGSHKDPHERSAAMKKVRRKVERFGQFFDEYKCVACSRRARVLIRDRAIPFVIEFGHAMPNETLHHSPDVILNPVNGRSCEAGPILSHALFMLQGETIILGICGGCLKVSYVPRAMELLETRYESLDHPA